jgi:hypothetical protein
MLSGEVQMSAWLTRLWPVETDRGDDEGLTCWKTVVPTLCFGALLNCVGNQVPNQDQASRYQTQSHPALPRLVVTFIIVSSQGHGVGKCLESGVEVASVSLEKVGKRCHWASGSFWLWYILIYFDKFWYVLISFRTFWLDFWGYMSMFDWIKTCT